MAEETRVYKHTDVHEDSGIGAVAIVAIVLVALVGIVLAVVFWDDMFGTRPVFAGTNTERTIIVDDGQDTVVTTSNQREVIRDSRSERVVEVPASDPEAGSTTSSSSTSESSSSSTQTSSGSTY